MVDIKKSLEIVGQTILSNNRSSLKPTYFSKIKAAFINSKLIIPKIYSIYNLINFNTNLLSDSTLLDNSTTCYLVNNIKLLFLGTYYKARDIDIIKVGTYAFLNKGYTKYLLKNIFYSLYSSNIKDLFLINIIT